MGHSQSKKLNDNISYIKSDDPMATPIKSEAMSSTEITGIILGILGVIILIVIGILIYNALRGSGSGSNIKGLSGYRGL